MWVREMERWLNVAEKPSVAKEVSTILSQGQKSMLPSFSKYNPVFDFDGQIAGGRTTKMFFTSVAGHIMEDSFPTSLSNWNTTPFHKLFSAKITKNVKKEFVNIQQNLEKYAKKSQRVVLWLDCDREGENICFEVLDIVLRANSRLAVSRAHFSALTARDILFAVNNLRAPDRNLSDAVEVRQELDFRVGSAFTRFQSVRFRDHFEDMPKLLSFGTCQMPTLGFVVQKHYERHGFQPEDFYHCEMQHEGCIFSWERGNIYDGLASLLVFEEMIVAAGL